MRSAENWGEYKKNLEEIGALKELNYGGQHYELGNSREVKDIEDPVLDNILEILNDSEYSNKVDELYIDIADPKVDEVLVGEDAVAVFGPEDKMDYRPRIGFSPNFLKIETDPEYFESVKEKRKITIDLLLAKLREKIKNDQLQITPKMLKTFIFLHETGHGIEYLDKYKKEDNSYMDAWKSRQKEYYESLDDLPISGLYTASAHKAVAILRGEEGFEDKSFADQVKDLEALIKNKILPTLRGKEYGGKLERGEVKYNINVDSFKNLDDLLNAHEIAEKKKEFEDFADRFAVDFMVGHWDELGLPFKK